MNDAEGFSNYVSSSNLQICLNPCVNFDNCMKLQAFNSDRFLGEKMLSVAEDSDCIYIFVISTHLRICDK